MNNTFRAISVFILLILLTQACKAPEDRQPVPVNELQSEDPVMQAIMDSVASKMRYYPDHVQFAMAFVDRDSVQYLGVLRDNDTLMEISNSDSVFEIGSITKVFTGIMLAEEVNNGDLELSTTLEDLGIETKTDYTYSLEELATHTSGMPRIPSNMQWSAFFNRDNPYKNYDSDKLRDYLKNDLETLSRPGTDYAYSNLGIGLLGYTLEVKTGREYEELLQSQLAGPLNMVLTTTDRDKISDQLVQGRDYNGKPASNWDMNVLMGAGGILSSPRDMSRFAMAQWDSTNSAIQMTQNPRHPVSSSMQIGLGWHIIYRNDGAWLWHNGGTGGYRSSIYVDEVRQKAVIILSNLSAGHSKSRLMDTLGQDLMEILTGTN